MIPPLGHAERKDERAIHVLKFESGIPKHVENYVETLYLVGNLP